MAEAERQALEDYLGPLLRQLPHASPQLAQSWEPIAILGRGGMGEVARVRDRRTGREAARKTLLSHATSPAQRARFLREAELTARLSHPRIPTLYEAGIDPDGRLVVILRLVLGESLRERLQGGPPPPAVALNWLIGITEAAAYAHDRGILHRDIKPENVMVNGEGELFLMDWGIARDLSEDAAADRAFSQAVAEAPEEAARSQLTAAGAVLGTPGYAAPEQLDGEAADGRADVFAIGCVMTELLTGQPAIPGDDALARMTATAEGRIRSPRALDSRASAELDWIARGALQADPSARSDAATLLARLRAAATHQPVPGYPYPLSQRARRWVESHLLASLLLTGIALAGAVGLAATSGSMQVLAGAGQSLGSSESERVDGRDVVDAMELARNAVRRGVAEPQRLALVERAIAVGEGSDLALLLAAEVHALALDLERSEALISEVEARSPGLPQVAEARDRVAQIAAQVRALEASRAQALESLELSRQDD